MSHDVRVCLDHFFAHILWTMIFQIFENSPLVVVESFSTYYGEVHLQKNWLIRKFNIYLITHMKANLILHRRGFAIFVNDSQIWSFLEPKF